MQKQTTVQDLEKLLNCSVNEWYKLREINLYNNQLQTLPPEVGQWTAAQDIDLGSNQLQSLPPNNILCKCVGINYANIIEKNSLKPICKKEDQILELDINRLKKRNELLEKVIKFLMDECTK